MAHHGLGRGGGVGERAEGPLLQIEFGPGELLAVVGQAQLFQLVAAISGGQEIGGHLGVKNEAVGSDTLGQEGPAQVFYPVGRLFDGGVGEERSDNFVVIFQLVRPQQACVPGIVVQVALHADRIQRGERDNVDHLLGPPQLQQAPGVLRGDLRLQIAAALQGRAGARTGLPLGGGQTVFVNEFGKFQLQKELIQPVVVRRLPQVILRLEVDGGVGADGGQIIGQQGALLALLQLLDEAGLGGHVGGGADVRHVVVQVGDSAVELDQRHGGFFPHPLHAGVVVGGVPHEGLQVDDVFGVEAVFLSEKLRSYVFGGGAAHSGGHQLDGGLVRHQLEGVLVSGDDGRLPAGGLVQPGDGAQQVIGLPAVQLVHGYVQGGQYLL